MSWCKRKTQVLYFSKWRRICHTNHFRNGWNFLNQGLQQLWLVRRGHKINHKFWQTSLHIPRTQIINKYNYQIQSENTVYNDILKIMNIPRTDMLQDFYGWKITQSIVVKSWTVLRVFVLVSWIVSYYVL